jgi:AraC-like DNA-binding protein
VARFDLDSAFYGGPGFTLYHAWGRNGSLPLAPHFHDEYLVSYQLAGVEECHVSGKLQEFEPGDVVFLNPQQVHTGNERGSTTLEYVSIYIDPEVVRRLAEELGTPPSTPEFTHIKAAAPGASAALGAKLLRLLAVARNAGEAGLGRHAYDDSNHPRPKALADLPEFAGIDVEAALQDVVAAAFEDHSNLRQPMMRSTNRIGHRKIARTLDYIRALDPQANPTNLTLDDLASVADLSKYHFLRQFSQVVGMTPGAYLRTLRLCHAARKLRTSQMPILDVALSVGFADHPSFSRAFARHMGMTPSEYQRMAGAWSGHAGGGGGSDPDGGDRGSSGAPPAAGGSAPSNGGGATGAAARAGLL